MRRLLLLLAAFLPLALYGGEDNKPRAARSVHLVFDAPETDLFYNEVTVEQTAAGSYFCVCGFSHGYFGIQELANGNKVAIFSVWDPGQQNDPNVVADEQRVKVISSGEGVKVSRFGGEGTGAKSMLDFGWKAGERYRLLVKAEVVGEKTTYAGYLYLNDKKEWQQMAAFQVKTKGEALKGFYSFVEDFRRDGKSPNERRAAQYSNGWVHTLKGDWVSLAKAKFTGDNTPLDNVDASAVEAGFLLVTGGNTKSSNPLNSMLTRKTQSQTPPDEALSGLKLR